MQVLRTFIFLWQVPRDPSYQPLKDEPSSSPINKVIQKTDLDRDSSRQYSGTRRIFQLERAVPLRTVENCLGPSSNLDQDSSRQYSGARHVFQLERAVPPRTVENCLGPSRNRPRTYLKNFSKSPVRQERWQESCLGPSRKPLISLLGFKTHS